MRRLIDSTLTLLVLSTLLPACGGDDGPADDGSSTGTDGSTTDATDTDAETDTDTETGTDETGDTDGDPALAFPGPTKGGPIAASPDNTRLAVVNARSGELTIFSLPALEEQARVDLGGEPESVAFSPTGDEIYVVLRGDGAIVRIAEIGTSPAIDATLAVGAEPGRAALSSTGGRLWVPLWGEGYVVAVDTEAMAIVSEVETGGSPYAACITNDLDLDEDDETVFVTDFYGVAAGGREATDGAREGRVFTIGSDGALDQVILPALTSSGTAGFEATGAYPNQLYSCAINQDVLYVTSVGASPAAFNGATDFHQNLQGLVHRVDLATLTADAQPTDLNGLIDGLAAPKRFVPVPIDIAFAPNSEFAYIASLTSDSVLRVDFSVSPPTAGSPSGASFLAASRSPSGVAIAGTDMFVANEVGHSISHMNLAQQVTVTADIESATGPGTAAGIEQLQGQRFFNTGLGRWSTNGWVSCAGCHPFGTTDNVTWSFPAGPRQTSDTSATFNAAATEQRILNWTAIFDEIHDFELNTRGVAGGTGAIVSDTALNDNGTANAAVQINIVGPGGVPDPINAFNRGSARGAALTGATPDDWDAIEAYVASLRSTYGTTRPGGDPLAGRAVFEEAGCDSCHGGSLWTLSRRTYTPAFNLDDGSDLDERQMTLLAAGVDTLGEVRADQVTSTDPGVLTVLSNDANGAPARHTCVARIVGTFDNDGPSSHGAEELRQSGGPAQGVDGYNVPSLLGVGRGAPFLHNGAAETLEELFDPSGEFTNHLRAGNQVFSPTPQQQADLIAFVKTIDDDTVPFAIDPAQDFCASNVPQQQ
ncbi:hypothetical protein [Enhygromyxa salina]|uniref:Cytochrome c domain-containing protein n=1 Tax=Enhygromyxa salina TaxID=215803 RepID=A0A2S9YFS0_9BACT|nr:hypothetical protein [Enhygromyxa salina]PRQ03954.1 hypothetical protein ENSA7_51510 [Enhygromyxa salina]